MLLKSIKKPEAWKGYPAFGIAFNDAGSYLSPDSRLTFQCQPKTFDQAPRWYPPGALAPWQPLRYSRPPDLPVPGYAGGISRRLGPTSALPGSAHASSWPAACHLPPGQGVGSALGPASRSPLGIFLPGSHRNSQTLNPACVTLLQNVDGYPPRR